MKKKKDFMVGELSLSKDEVKHVVVLLQVEEKKNAHLQTRLKNLGSSIAFLENTVTNGRIVAFRNYIEKLTLWKLANLKDALPTKFSWMA